MTSKSLLLVLMGSLLMGCQANDESLTDFIRGVETQARREVEKLKPQTSMLQSRTHRKYSVHPLNYPKKPSSRLSQLQEKIVGNRPQEGELEN